MFKRAFRAAAIITILISATIAIAVIVGARVSQQAVVIAIMRHEAANLPPFNPEVTVPFLRVIDFQRRLSVIMRPPLSGVVDIHSEFSQEPSFRVYAADVQIQDDGGAATTYGFYRYQPFTGLVQPVFERQVGQFVAIRSGQDFRVDMSFGPGKLSFVDPATGERFVLDTQTGALSDYVDLERLGATRDVLWWSPDRSRFGYVKSGYLAVASEDGEILSEFPEIQMNDMHAVSWMDGGRSLLVTSNADPTLPNHYIDATTGAVIHPLIAELDGYRVRFRQDCGPNIITYEQVNQELVVVDLRTEEEWKIVQPETSNEFLNQVQLLNGCEQAIIIAGVTTPGQYQPGSIYLSDGHGENARLLHENAFLFRPPDREGNYMFGERLPNNRLRLYEANLFDDGEPELWREVPDLAQMQNPQLLDDVILYSAGEGFSDRRLAMVDYSGEHTMYLTPDDEHLVFFRYYEPEN